MRGEPASRVEGPGAPWQMAIDPPSRLEAVSGALTLIAAPGQRAAASPRLPVVSPLPPRGRFAEELAWIAQVDISENRRYLALCELRFAGEPGSVLVQPTPFDLQVTQDPLRPGGGSSVSVSRLVADGAEHAWRVRSDGTRTTLLLDGAPVWWLDGLHPLSRVAFGEVRPDDQHGGLLRLRDIVYVRRPRLPTDVPPV